MNELNKQTETINFLVFVRGWQPKRKTRKKFLPAPEINKHQVALNVESLFLVTPRVTLQNSSKYKQMIGRTLCVASLWVDLEKRSNLNCRMIACSCGSWYVHCSFVVLNWNFLSLSLCLSYQACWKHIEWLISYHFVYLSFMMALQEKSKKTFRTRAKLSSFCYLQMTWKISIPTHMNNTYWLLLGFFVASSFHLLLFIRKMWKLLWEMTLWSQKFSWTPKHIPFELRLFCKQLVCTYK